MKVLVTGAQGFVGRVMVRALRERGDAVVATGRREAHEVEGAPFVRCDLGEEEAVQELVRDAAPDAIVHLAGMTYLPAVLERPADAFVANVLSAQNLLQAAATWAPDCRVLLVSSCTVYGGPPPEAMPLTETSPLLAMHPYGVQKIGAEVLGLRACEREGQDVVIARPFNHTGPGQDERISTIHFARQIAAAERGEHEPVLLVGNLKPKRDFLDVRDVAAAYLALLDHERPPAIVNVSSGRSIPIRQVLDHLLSAARVSVEVREDPARLRPNDVMDLVGDSSLLREATGWEPRYALEDTFARVLSAARGEDFGALV